MAPRKQAIMYDHFFMLGLALLCLSGIPLRSEAIDCEDLPAEKCAFAVSSVGMRCVLEKNVAKDGLSEYKCQTSFIMAERQTELIESDTCIQSCGLQRLSVGFSTDALLENDFVRQLCLSDCRASCPNINDLYTKLAAGDGIHLDSLCNALKEKRQRFVNRAQASARLDVVGKAQLSRVNSTTPSNKGIPVASPEPSETCTVTCAPAAAAKPPTPAKSPSNLPYYTTNHGWGEAPTASPTAPPPGYTAPSPTSNYGAPSPAYTPVASPTLAPTLPPTMPPTRVGGVPPRAGVSLPPLPIPLPRPPSLPPPLPLPLSSPPPPPPSLPPPPPPRPPSVPDLFHGLFPRRRRFPPV